ncbi:hypothetical protein F441_16986 [Phytophthora nicotianae CJ01A1]|uniref:Uncharacterized protein n=2 Tax=Phytophthora nicotianae TaxID=4792 RepID=W2WAZ9_PHYNI|nr:hypothetical protein L916_16559 [Phytophthora nicotianae]ETP06724.1 hypothetical protein F441_16986 [Phytophthora nicotianae CJ01A1]
MIDGVLKELMPTVTYSCTCTHVRSINRCNACRMTTNESMDHPHRHRRLGTAMAGSLTVDRHHRQKRQLTLSCGGTSAVSTETSMTMSARPSSSISNGYGCQSSSTISR